MAEIDKGEMSAREAGRRGGNKTKEKYGIEHFAKAGRIGGETIVKKFGRKFLSEIGKKGGKARHKISE